MKTKIVTLLFGAVLLLMASCAKDKSSMTKATLIFKSSQTASPVLKGTLGEVSVVITDFMINVREIEFCIDEDEEGLEVEDSTYDEIELEGPFMLDLMVDGAPVQDVLGDFEIPNAAYDEIEFELSPYTGGPADHPLQGRSYFLAGTYGDMPMEIWHNTDDEVEIEFPDSSSIVLSGSDLQIYIDFHIDQIVAGLTALDLSSATDGNGNGIIEIGHDDTDGNNHLANSIKEIIKESSDLDDDDDNDNDHDDD